MTASTEMPGSAESRRSEGTANSGVPQIRCAWQAPARYGLPLAGLPQFADAAFDQVPFQHAEVLDKQDAVQVIDS